MDGEEDWGRVGWEGEEGVGIMEIRTFRNMGVFSRGVLGVWERRMIGLR